MNKFEQFAVDYYLSDYPDNLDFISILGLIQNDNESIIIWHYFENENKLELCDLICDLKSSLENTFN